MIQFFSKLLLTYGYGSTKELLYSMFPSWKYQLQYFSLALSAISGLLSSLFGFGSAIAVAMFIAVVVEVRTGIKASQKQGYSFESFRFSRCILKLTLWAVIFYIIHQFENEYEYRTHVFDILAFAFFKVLFLVALSFFVVEHVTSILENKAIIDGKPKTALIEIIQNFWKQFIDMLKGKFK